jgi:hypothetical protein
MKQKHLELKKGDSVVIKKGIKDPDSGVDIGGWQGRITEEKQEEDETIICVAWDSMTLKNMPKPFLEESEVGGLDWRVMYVGIEDVQAAQPRDTQMDVQKAVKEIEGNIGWLGIGEEGKRIQKVLAGADIDDEIGTLDAWDEYLEENLTFPFEAEVSEYQERGPIRAGDKLTVMSITDVDEMYGLIVGVKRGHESYDFPLCDLTVVGNESSNKQIVKDYAVWFANR